MKKKYKAVMLVQEIVGLDKYPIGEWMQCVFEIDDNCKGENDIELMLSGYGKGFAKHFAPLISENFQKDQ